jgi:hypothetical protein
MAISTKGWAPLHSLMVLEVEGFGRRSKLF